MTNQPGRDKSGSYTRVKLSIASPLEIEHTARQLRTIRESFLSTGSLATAIPRSIIMDSWQRCSNMHVNPSRRSAPLAIARDSQLHQLRQANELLIRATRSVMDRLTNFLADSGYVIVLSDARGCLLDVVGDAMIRRRLAHIDFVPGGNWSEAGAGTNAIGTALADGHVVQLMAAEHYCDGWQDLTCTASPIRHPFTGQVIGVLDITGDYRLIRPFLTSSLAAAALEVQQELRTLQDIRDQGDREGRTYHTAGDFAGSANSSEREPATLLRASASPLVDSNGGSAKGNISLPIGTRAESMGARAEQAHAPTMVSTHPKVEDGWLSLNLQKRRTRDAELLAAAAGAVSASLDLQDTLEKVAEQAVQLLQLESSAVFLFDDMGDLMSPYIWSRHHSSQSEPLRGLEEMLAQSEATTLIRERGEPVIIDNILAPSVLPVNRVEFMEIRSLALLPLVTARGVSGFIAAPRSIPYHWDINEVRLGLALAAQSATAIENARLFDILQQHNRRIEVLNSMAQLLSTLPHPNQHLNLVLKRIVEIMDLDAGVILLLDHTTAALDLVTHRGLSAFAALDLHAFPLQPLYEIARLVAASRESLLVCSVESDGHIVHESLHAAGFCELMAIPLLASKTLLGVLLIGSHNPRGLTEEDLGLYTTIGQQLGLALNNAQLLRSASDMEALREADRLKNGFLAAVSHDLRSPLTAIRTSVESLLDRGGIQSTLEQEHLLHNIADQAGRLGRLVDQILDFSRIEGGVLSLDRDWTELPALIADTITKFEELNAGCHVERDLQQDLPLHYVDPDRLVQVLWNLLENAYKYSPTPANATVAATWTGTDVVISVADRGPGIPAGEHQKIFQRFYRLNRDHRARTSGTGLGLAICKGIVEAHGGKIWVEDRPGAGSIFRIALPLPATSPIGFETVENVNCAV